MRRASLIARIAILPLSVLPACDNAGRDTAHVANAHEAVLDAAPRLTVAAGTARTESTATLSDVSGLPGPVTLTATGAVDFAGRRAVSTVDLSSLLSGTEADDEARSLVTVFLQGTVLVRSPVLTSLLGVHTPWMRIDRATAPTTGTGADLGRLMKVPGSDGSALVGLLLGVVPGSVHELGQEDVRSETATHLRATVDFRAAVERAGALTDGDRFEQFTAALGAQDLALDAFVDGEGRLRRLAFEHELPAETGGGRQRVEVDLFDFGIPVDITAPPDDQVTDLVAELDGDGRRATGDG